MRKGEFWAIPKEILAIKEVSLEARVLFGVLWTMRNGENLAWPGQRRLAQILGVSPRSVIRYIKELEGKGLLIRQRKGLRRTNRYQLLIGQVVTSKSDIAVTSRSDKLSLPIVNRTEVKDKKYLTTTDVVVAEQGSAAPLAREVNKLIKLFSAVNPSYARLFVNKAQRAAIERLLRKHGREKMEQLIKSLSMTNRMRYAPVITTLLKLEERLGDLLAFMAKERLKVEENMVAVIQTE
jgi:DNA-binding Lrp family transcriptional regulator